MWLHKGEGLTVFGGISTFPLMALLYCFWDNSDGASIYLFIVLEGHVWVDLYQQPPEETWYHCNPESVYWVLNCCEWWWPKSPKDWLAAGVAAQLLHLQHGFNPASHRQKVSIYSKSLCQDGVQGNPWGIMLILESSPAYWEIPANWTASIPYTNFTK